jgi:phosphoenolpyruvate carboxylase
MVKVTEKLRSLSQNLPLVRRVPLTLGAFLKFSRGARGLATNFAETYQATDPEKTIPIRARRTIRLELIANKWLQTRDPKHLKNLTEEEKYDIVVNRPFKTLSMSFLDIEYPLGDIRETAKTLDEFKSFARQRIDNKSPWEIVQEFLNQKFSTEIDSQQKYVVLNFMRQWTERLVVLHDSVENANADILYPLDGPGTIQHLHEVCEKNGITQAFKETLRETKVKVVLTSHPTQYYSKVILNFIEQIEGLLKAQSSAKSDAERLECENKLKDQIQKLSGAPFTSEVKITPLDEVEGMVKHLRVFYEAIGKSQSKINKLLRENYTDNLFLANFIVGFWPGGDRDGNPFVTHVLTKQTGALLKSSILDLYRTDMTKMFKDNTFSSKATSNIFDAISKKLERTANSTHSDESRVVYSTAEDFFNELLNLKEAYIESLPSPPTTYDKAIEVLDNLIAKVKVFGFHFAPVDIRQNSKIHKRVVNNILREQDSNGNTFVDEFDRLKHYAFNNFILPEVISEEASEALETIEAIKDIQSKNGEEGCSRYIISNTSEPEDVLRVMLLARAKGLIKNYEIEVDGITETLNTVPLDITPLFETIDDLANSEQTMNTLFQLKEYRKHLVARGNKQYIMLGFSDSNKDGGPTASIWSIKETKERLIELGKKYGIEIIFFDGRGGPASRGGGSTHDYYRGANIYARQIELTIQGQSVGTYFGSPPLAMYNYEQYLSAAVENMLSLLEDDSVESQKCREIFRSYKFSPEENEIIQQLIQSSREHYAGVVNPESGDVIIEGLLRDPKFIPYLKNITPLNFLSNVSIASRPVARNTDGELQLEDLRAISFVTAWTLMAQNIGGYYGVGTSLKELIEGGQLDKLRTMYKHSLPFKTWISNVMQSLKKTNLALTKYLESNEEYGSIYKKIKDEYELTINAINKITGYSETDLMSDRPTAKLSVEARLDLIFPQYVIQHAILERLHADYPNLNPSAIINPAKFIVAELKKKDKSGILTPEKDGTFKIPNDENLGFRREQFNLAELQKLFSEEEISNLLAQDDTSDFIPNDIAFLVKQYYYSISTIINALRNAV